MPSIRSRLLIAATAAAALAAFGAAPTLAAGMASTHDHMSGNGMSTHRMTHHATETQHKKKATSKGEPAGTMAPHNSMK